MNYSPDGFNALQEALERRGGALLPDICTPQDVRRTKKQGYTKDKTEKATTCGCNNLSMFVIPYKGEPKVNRPHFVTACAVCDAIGAWPIVCEDVYEADPDMDPMLDEYDELDEDEANGG